jgi:hypothetical protein
MTMRCTKLSHPRRWTATAPALAAGLLPAPPWPLLHGAPMSGTIALENFTAIELALGLALAVYPTAGRRSADGALVRSRRSSIWMHDGEAWRMPFHQGTPLGA